MITDIIYAIILFIASYFTFFHLVLWLEHKGKFFEKKKIKKLPSVSIIVPAYNEENVIEKTIKNLLKINYPKNKLEIFVIDDGSKDRTYEIAKKYQSKTVKVFTKPNGGKANAINFGLRRARNEFVAVMDADSLPSKNALINCMKYFDKEDVAAVTTNILPKKRSLWEKLQRIELMFISFLRKLQEFPNVINVTPGPFSIYKKNILKKLGGFDEKNLVEDVEIAWRLIARGYRVRMAFDSRVECFYPYHFRLWWKQRVRWGIGGIQTLVKYFNSMFTRSAHTTGSFLVPTTFIGYVFVLIIIGLFIYVVGTQIFTLSAYIIKSLLVGIDPFSRFSLSYMLSFYNIYSLLLFPLFIVILTLVLSIYRMKINPMHVLLFMTIYATLYPFIGLHSIYKYLKNERGWLTK